MAYATLADLLTRFGAEELAQVSDRGMPRLVTAELIASAASGTDMAGWSGADVEALGAATATISRAIEDAESVIDGYLSGRYITPLEPVSAVIKRLTCDLVRYFLYDDHATETVQKRYDAAIAYFRDISSGKVSLAADGLGQAQAGGSVEIVTAGRPFSRAERGL